MKIESTDLGHLSGPLSALSLDYDDKAPPKLLGEAARQARASKGVGRKDRGVRKGTLNGENSPQIHKGRNRWNGENSPHP